MATTKSTIPTKTILHPLVLLSVVDHYNRVAKDTNKRVCGVLLGQNNNGVANITSSFAVPFEEDRANLSSWYLDHNYLENFMALHKKVTSEKILGWYSSSPLISQNDLDVHEVFRRYCEEPIFFCINVRDHTQQMFNNDNNNNNNTTDGNTDETSIVATNQYSAPAKAFCSVALNKDEIQAQSTEKSNNNNNNNNNNKGNNNNRHFVHVHVEIGSDEAEEVGIEHVLRSINQQHKMNLSGAPTTTQNSNTATLSDLLQSKLSALHGFLNKMSNISTYLTDVIDGKLPYNNSIINRIQDIVSLVPVITNPQLSEALSSYTNDAMTVIYVTTIIRSITALHDLIKNKEVTIAALYDENIKKAFLESTKVNNNTKSSKAVADNDEFNMDSVAHDRGDENKH